MGSHSVEVMRFKFVMVDNLALPLLEVPPTSVATDEGFVDEENERIPDLNFPPPDLSPRLIRYRDGSISGGGFPMGSTACYLVPHTKMVTAGENIVETISIFLLMASGFVTILSAVGAISFADFYLPGSEVIRHEGCFQLLLLSGNFLCPPMRGVRSAECPLIVSLVDACDVVFGGAVAGYLIAACPVEV